MHEDVPTKAIAACFGLAGFVVAIICGMVVNNPIDAILTRAVPAMFVCVIVGYGIGTFTTRAISHNIQLAAKATAAAAAEAADAATRIAQQEADAAAHSKSGGTAGSRAAHATNTPITTPARASSPTSRKAAA